MGGKSERWASRTWLHHNLNCIFLFPFPLDKRVALRRKMMFARLECGEGLAYATVVCPCVLLYIRLSHKHVRSGSGIFLQTLRQKTAQSLRACKLRYAPGKYAVPAMQRWQPRRIYREGFCYLVLLRWIWLHSVIFLFPRALLAGDRFSLYLDRPIGSDVCI